MVFEPGGVSNGFAPAPEGTKPDGNWFRGGSRYIE